MAFLGFHGVPRELQLNVLECNIMSDRDSSMRQTEWYLCVHYGSKIFVINSTYTDGGINPTFQDKIVFEPTEPAGELTVVVARNKTFAPEDVVGTATIQLDAVLQQSYGEFRCALQKTSSGSRAGELKLRLKLKNADNNTFRGPRVPLLEAPGAGRHILQAAPPSHNYTYNLAPYPPYPYPPAYPIPHYYFPPPSPYPQPQHQPLLYPQIIVSHGIGGVVSAFVEQLFQNLSANLFQYYGGLGFNN